MGADGALAVHARTVGGLSRPGVGTKKNLPALRRGGCSKGPSPAEETDGNRSRLPEDSMQGTCHAAAAPVHPSGRRLPAAAAGPDA